MGKYNNCKYGFFAGFTLCIISFLSSICAYFRIKSGWFSLQITSTIFSVVIVVVFTLIYRKPSFSQMLLRLLCLIGSYFVFWVSGAYIGIWRAVYQNVNPLPSSASENISGMLWFFPFLVAQITALITLLIKAVHCISLRICRVI